MAGALFIGTSGWNYRHWGNDRFYPRTLSQKEWLSFYTRHFFTVELNSTFYRLPSPETFSNWAKTVPAKFVFAVKANRFITHIKRLKEPEQSVRLFLSHLSRLGKKRGPILFQLPPQMKVDPGRLKGLIRCLKKQKGLRIVLEFRHESWLTDEVYELVEDAGWTICLADWPHLKQPPLLAPFCYIRRHGASALYASCYSDEQLAQDADLAMKLAKQGKDVYIYFNNDAQAYAVKNAQTLIRMIKPEYLATGARKKTGGQNWR
ncbi:MAG: DUF72 domain-containing protein [Candidatus Binatia bacterium]